MYTPIYMRWGSRSYTTLSIWDSIVYTFSMERFIVYDTQELEQKSQRRRRFRPLRTPPSKMHALNAIASYLEPTFVLQQGLSSSIPTSFRSSALAQKLFSPIASHGVLSYCYRSFIFTRFYFGFCNCRNWQRCVEK